jgi:hypothetical protein
MYLHESNGSDTNPYGTKNHKYMAEYTHPNPKVNTTSSEGSFVAIFLFKTLYNANSEAASNASNIDKSPPE